MKTTDKSLREDFFLYSLIHNAPFDNRAFTTVAEQPNLRGAFVPAVETVYRQRVR